MPSDTSDLEKRLRAAVVALVGVDRKDLLDDAADEIARLRADFLKYAVEHEHGCEDGSASGDPCSCGLDAARARIKGSS